MVIEHEPPRAEIERLRTKNEWLAEEVRRANERAHWHHENTNRWMARALAAEAEVEHEHEANGNGEHMSRQTRTGWALVTVPAPLAALAPLTKAYQKDTDDGHLSVFVGPEPDGFHLSISHRTNDLAPGRYPTWDEITEARYKFCPAAMTMAMLLPPPDEYVNIHETTFHLWEIVR